MSTFFDETIICPHCQHSAMYRVAHSINGQRAPQYREQILARTFQHVTCSDCAQPFVINHPMAYVDLSRKQWFHVYSYEQEDAWRAMEEETAETFRMAAGPRAPAAARALLEGVTVRTVFGLEGLREKLICQEVNLDDAILEILKLGLGNAPAGIPLSERYHLRLLEQSEAALVLGAAGEGQEGLLEIELPHAAYEAVASEPARWQGLYKQLSARLYVDVGRFFIPGTSAF